MTYENVVKRGLFCNCRVRLPQGLKHDTWGDWLLCGQCRLPIKGSNHAGPAGEERRENP